MAPPYLVRRLLLPLILAGEVLLLGLLTVALLIGLVVLPMDRRLRLARLSLMGGSYLLLEWAGLLGLLGVWMAGLFLGPEWRQRADVTVTGWVLGQVLGAARVTVGFRLDLDEPADPGPFAGTDPVLVLARHGGIGDSFALVWLLVARYGKRPRVVLKQILIWEPLIDVALSRLGACFIPPSRPPGEPLENRVAQLAGEIEPGDALLLFPEGGNWTPRRRLVAIGRLWAARKPAAAKAAALMEHVLPPRAGGVLACLDTRPELPVVIVAHTGLDRITSARQLWRAVPFTAAMEVRWWPPAHPPYGDDERLAWLTTEWAVVDQWIDGRRA